MNDPEYWVMRALYVSTDNDGRRPLTRRLLTPVGESALEWCVETGTLAECPGSGEILEPVEVFSTEQPARQHAELMRVKFPGEDFRVLMNVDIAI